MPQGFDQAAVVPSPETPVTHWAIELVVTETMPYVEESRKAVIADRLLTAIPHSSILLRKIEKMR